MAPEPHGGYTSRRLVTGAKYLSCLTPHSGQGWENMFAGLCTKLGARGWKRWVKGRGIEGREAMVKGKTWGYPDEIDFNGTTYTDGGRNDLVYRDSMGGVLDLNLLRGEDK